MSANLQPITTDGGLLTAGNISTFGVASPAPYITGFSSITTTEGANLGGFDFTSNGILTVPDGEGVFRSNNDTITIQSYDVPNSTARGVRFGTNGGAYFEQTNLIATSTWLSINANEGNAEISAGGGVGSGSTEGKHLSITGGIADQTTYNTSPGGNVNIVGGLGASDDGGGGGPGGSVNITAGASADPAGHAGNVVIQTGGSNNWAFDYTGNLTLPGNTFAVNYANGTQVSISGGGSSYSNSDVVTLLGSFGSNTISTTGNVSSGNVLGNGYARFIGSFDESQASTAGLYLGYAGGTPRMMFGTGNTSQTFEIDNDGGNLRFYQPGSTKATLTSGGAFSAAGNVTGANITTAGNVAFTANSSAIAFNTGAFISGNANSITRDGSILLQPYTGAGSTFPGVIIGGAGRLLAPNGGVFQIFNSSDVTFQVPVKVTSVTAATSTITGALIVSGGAGLAGSITTGVGALLTGPTFTPLANTMAGFVSNVNSYTQLTIQNKSTGADATTDFVATADNGSDTVNYLDLGIINSGYDNLTPTNSLGNIVYAADSYLYAQGNVSNTSQSGGNLAIGTTIAGKSVKIFAGGATSNSIIATISNTGLAVNGNVTATNFSGNISVTGNVTGTSPNVTLVAGSYSYIFDNAGTLTLPTGITGNEGGEIAFTQAANSTLGGNTVVIDQYVDRIRFFEGGGNARGAYIDFTQAADGVATLLNNRVSGLVNAGTFVTMDLIKATVTSSGNRGLSLAATTGSFSILIAGNYATSGGANGSSGSATITTTPSNSQFNWNFTAAGDIATYIITDTTNNRAYRITIQIGASFNNNLISIERLV